MKGPLSAPGSLLQGKKPDSGSHSWPCKLKSLWPLQNEYDTHAYVTYILSCDFSTWFFLDFVQATANFLAMLLHLMIMIWKCINHFKDIVYWKANMNEAMAKPNGERTDISLWYLFVFTPSPSVISTKLKGLLKEPIFMLFINPN